LAGTPSDSTLATLLDRYAPYGPAPLVPEVSVFYGRSLIEVWEAAERLANQTLPAPFWAYPWAAGIAIARVVLDHPEWIIGKRVLDFGCGGGIASFAAARAGAESVIANDVDAWALAITRIAAARQGFMIRPLLADLTASARAQPAVDIVLCSDLAYEKRKAQRQRTFLERARRNGARVFVADAGRKYFNADGLLPLATFNIAVPKDLEGVDERVARVYEMT
jgi:predicted nicotinamide N-methyase